MPKPINPKIEPNRQRSRRVRRNNFVILMLMLIALAALFATMMTRNSPDFITGKTVRYECPAGYLKANGHPFWAGAPVCVPGVPATRIEE